MCGITGIIDFKRKKIPLAKIKQMTDTLIHRGPNGSNFFSEGNIAMGHQRLAIFDLTEAGRQPMDSIDKRYVITYNGEVYNWPEIRKELNNKNWFSKTDTETILQAYSERGVECLKIFNGMFALAIWDRKEKNLFLARDRIGIKPLYYGFHDGRFYFASEIKALFAAGFPKKVNYSAIYDFLRWGLIDHSNDTFFEGIFSLQPSCYLYIDKNGLKSADNYWNLINIVKESAKIDTQEATEQYNFLIKDSLKIRSRSDVPIGVFLSGGVDSSILASYLAKKITNKNLDAYTYDFNPGKNGEGDYAREVAGLLGLESKIALLKHSQIPAYFSKVLYHQEMPVTSLRVIAAHKLYEEFKDTGSPVVLEGHGGDHIGSGFEYYIMPYIMDKINHMEAKEAFTLWNNFMDIYAIPSDIRYQKLFNYLIATLRTGVCTQDGTPFVKTSCICEDFRNNYETKTIDFPRPFKSYLLNSQYIDLYYHNLPRVLRYTDRASMAAGREARLPMLDHRIVELGFRSRENARIHNNQQRYFMRKAAKELLPEKILRRPKRSIVDPQRNWLQKELKPWVEDIFHSSSFGRRKVFAQKEVIKEYEEYCKEKIPVTAFHIFQYINVELWFREMID